MREGGGVDQQVTGPSTAKYRRVDTCKPTRRQYSHSAECIAVTMVSTPWPLAPSSQRRRYCNFLGPKTCFPVDVCSETPIFTPSGAKPPPTLLIYVKNRG